MNGQGLLFVNASKIQSGKCPFQYVIDCFKKVFGITRHEQVVFEMDKYGNTIESSYIHYTLEGKYIVKGRGDPFNDQKHSFKTSNNLLKGYHSFKDDRGVNWQESCYHYLDALSGYFVPSNVLAYLTHFWGDIKTNKKHMTDLNKFLSAHGEPQIELTT